jgi:hypothetical protein
VYLDEAGVDDTEDYPYGYCPRSERFHALKLGHRTRRSSRVAGWRDRSVVAPMTFEGYGNTDLFEAWVERYLVPELNPGQVVVMDNLVSFETPFTATLSGLFCTTKRPRS